MIQSWIIYSISTGHIVCYGKQVDCIADQTRIDSGDTSCTLYMIQQICNANPDLSCLYSSPGAVDNLDDLSGVDHDTQSLTSMSLDDIKAEIKRLVNNDIVSRFANMKSVRDCIERIQGAVPSEAIIIANIETWMDGLESAKITIDGQVSGLATQNDALQYYGSRSWLSEFPAPVLWEGM